MGNGSGLRENLDGLIAAASQILQESEPLPVRSPLGVHERIARRHGQLL